MEEQDTSTISNIEEWQRMVDARVAHHSGSVALTGEMKPAAEVIVPNVLNAETPNSERFADYPNRQKSLRAKDTDNKTVFAKTAVAKKLYRCPCCQDDISIGAEHVLTYRVQESKYYDHHHVHGQCFISDVIDNLSDVKVIDSKDTTPKELTKKSRNYRARQSRRRRRTI